MKLYTYFHISIFAVCALHIKYFYFLLSEKIKISNDGIMVPVKIHESIPYWFSQGYYEDTGLYYSLLILVPVLLWSFFTSIDMISLIIRKKTRAEIFNNKPKSD